LLEEDRAKLKLERESLLSERLTLEETTNEIRRERESLEVERKNYENDRSR